MHLASCNHVVQSHSSVMSDHIFESDDFFFSVTLYSMRVECVCGKKSSTGGVRQLFFQQLGQWWRRRQERVCKQSDGNHRDCDHGGWQGNHSAHHGCQKWEGSLQQVHTLTVKWFCWFCLYWCSVLPLYPFFPLPNFSLHSFTSSSSVFVLIFPTSCLFLPFLSHLDSRVFRPAVRRYVVLEVLCFTVWNVFMKLCEGL